MKPEASDIVMGMKPSVKFRAQVSAWAVTLVLLTFHPLPHVAAPAHVLRQESGSTQAIIKPYLCMCVRTYEDGSHCDVSVSVPSWVGIALPAEGIEENAKSLKISTDSADGQHTVTHTEQRFQGTGREDPTLTRH
jgi:hypothetical protein